MRLLDRMHTKGWSSEELAHLEHHITVAKTKQESTAILTERFLYWSLLLCIVVGIVAFSYFLFPFFSVMPVFIGNLLTAFVAGCTAALFGHVLHGLDELQKSHHVLVLLVAAISAVGSSWLLVAHNLRLGALFAVTFSLLYGYYWWLAYERNRPA